MFSVRFTGEKTAIATAIIGQTDNRQKNRRCIIYRPEYLVIRPSVGQCVRHVCPAWPHAAPISCFLLSCQLSSQTKRTPPVTKRGGIYGSVQTGATAPSCLHSSAQTLSKESLCVIRQPATLQNERHQTQLGLSQEQNSNISALISDTHRQPAHLALSG